jgi:hypothetical protein
MLQAATRLKTLAGNGDASRGRRLSPFSHRCRSVAAAAAAADDDEEQRKRAPVSADRRTRVAKITAGTYSSFSRLSLTVSREFSRMSDVDRSQIDAEMYALMCTSRARPPLRRCATKVRAPIDLLPPTPHLFPLSHHFAMPAPSPRTAHARTAGYPTTTKRVTRRLPAPTTAETVMAEAGGDSAMPGVFTRA